MIKRLPSIELAGTKPLHYFNTFDINCFPFYVMVFFFTRKRDSLCKVIRKEPAKLWYGILPRSRNTEFRANKRLMQHLMSVYHLNIIFKNILWNCAKMRKYFIISILIFFSIRAKALSLSYIIKIHAQEFKLKRVKEI